MGAVGDILSVSCIYFVSVKGLRVQLSGEAWGVTDTDCFERMQKKEGRERVRV